MCALNSPKTLDAIYAKTAFAYSEFKQGDVLFIRWGFSVEYKAVSDNKRIDLSKSMSHAGMAQTEEVLRWVWDRQFAAVASDSPQFEACREVASSLLSRSSAQSLSAGIHGQEFLLHSTFIAGWGLPIGKPPHALRTAAAKVCNDAAARRRNLYARRIITRTWKAEPHILFSYLRSDELPQTGRVAAICSSHSLSLDSNLHSSSLMQYTNFYYFPVLKNSAVVSAMVFVAKTIFS